MLVSKPCPHCGGDVVMYRNPVPTVDVVIYDPALGVVLIERNNPPFGWALPGGFVDYRYLNDKKETCPVKLYQDIIDDAQFAEFIFDNPYEQEMHDFFEMIKNPALAPAHDYEKYKIIIDFIDRIENSL